MQFKDVHWQLYAYIDFLLCYVQLLFISPSDHTQKKTKRHHLFLTPKWKLLNRKAISPQTEIADSSQSVF